MTAAATEDEGNEIDWGSEAAASVSVSVSSVNADVNADAEADAEADVDAETPRTTEGNGDVEVVEEEPRERSPSPFFQFLSDVVPKRYLQDDRLESIRFYSRAAGGLLGAVFVCNPLLVLRTIWEILGRILGTAVGIGLGAGLALHVFQQLQKWQTEYDRQKQQESKRVALSNRQKTLEEQIAASRRRHMRQKAMGFGGASSLPTHTASISGDASHNNPSDQSTDSDHRKNSHGSNNHNHNHNHNHNTHSFFASATAIGDAVAVGAEDGDSYVGLMGQAGYPFHDRIMRGQVLREDHVFFSKLYKFTDETIPRQLGVLWVAEEWPSLPGAVTRELGRFIEHVMRDFVSSWYSLLDPGISFRLEQEKRDEGIPRDAQKPSDGARGTDDSVNSNGAPGAPADRPASGGSDKDGDKESGGDKASSQQRKKMVFSTLTHRRAPMIDCCYKMMSSVVGNLATRAEHVNLLELVLLKWTQVLGQTLNEYRTLRKVAQDKRRASGANSGQTRSSGSGNGKHPSSAFQSSVSSTASTKSTKSKPTTEQPPPSEVEVTREFLLAGKLHRAITFGLDVPSLLFADASGKECGLGIEANEGNSDTRTSNNSNAATNTHHDPRTVLEHRLYHTDILRECQIDYHRVLANRLIRALMPKSETNSQCVVAMLTEIIGGAVLTPVYNLWVPNFMNDCIVKVLTTATATAVPSDVRSANHQNSSSKTTRAAAAKTPGDSGNSTNNDKALANATYRLEESIHLGDAQQNSFSHAAEASDSDAMENAARTDQPTQQQGKPATDSHLEQQIPPTSTNSVTSRDSERPLSKNSNSGTKEKASEYTDDTGRLTRSYKLLKLSSIALKDLAKHTSLNPSQNQDESSEARESVDWNDANCQHSALKLAMVIEAMLLDGRCAFNEKEKEKEVFPDLLAGAENDPTVTETEPGGDPNSLALDTSTPGNNGTFGSADCTSATEHRDNRSFADLLMEMSSDMEAFEDKLRNTPAPASHALSVPRHGRSSPDFEPDVDEVAKLRSLICAWLHTGQLFEAVRLISKAVDTIFAPYYAGDAFLLKQDQREIFTRQMQPLDKVEIMVDAMTVRIFPRLVVSEEFDQLVSDLTEAAPQKQASKPTTAKASSNSGVVQLAAVKDTHIATNDSYHYYGHQFTPRYLNFQRNEAFAASLRAERKRRWRAWETRTMEKDVQTVMRNKASARDYELHSEMHNLSRLFYNGTAIMTVRDAARKNERVEEKVSLLTVEIASSRRRIEVPDDDSSFLLRAQSRQLSPVSVHLDDRNHDMGYKCFLATYEEPALTQGSSRYSDGRYIRRCFLQYYPSDRTARIVLQNDARKLDKRKEIGGNEHSTENQISSSFSRAFLNQRYLCQKVGVAQSFMSSTLMEPTDFSAFPRSGKALDFVYRMSLFNRPIVDLGGKQFKIQDSSSRGIHRADASSFEVTDASLSYVLLKIGKSLGINQQEELGDGKPTGGFRNVETGPDGYPVLFLRFTKTGEKGGTEFKPYRLSFVRAALMVTSARQEAQLGTLIECVRAGSAKSATKARTEEQLRPVKKILHFANERSDQNFNQDLKLGQFLDRGQLQRNGLLNLRHPTSILQLEAKVEGTALAKEVPLASASTKSYNPDTVLYRIRCTVVVELVENNGTLTDFEPYALDDGSYARFYREEYIVHRSMTEFQTLHKQLKSQVALTESTMSTGNRIVGAASAALHVGSQSTSINRRNKKILIPSLAQAGKIGALGMTKKLILKRMELLGEYIDYLLASNSLMNRCSELLLFLGASHPFPPEVTMTKAQTNIMDLLGRTNFVRSIALKDIAGSKLMMKISTHGRPRYRSVSERSLIEKPNENGREPAESIKMDPIILNKVDQIPLAEVRNRILELFRLSFNFEHASFMRSQLLTALETASFLAVAKQSDFRRVLHDIHTKHLSGEAIGGLIERVLDILWPDGIFMKPAPLPTPEEEIALRDAAKKKLHEGFPDQVRTLLGKEMTEEGLNMIHEMLQNRVILKSLFYMLLDLLWIEVFPELRDALPCASALDLDLL